MDGKKEEDHMANETRTIRVVYYKTDSAEHGLIYGVPEDYTVEKVIDFLDGLVTEGWTWCDKDDDRSKITVYVQIIREKRIRPGGEVFLIPEESPRFYHPPEGMELRGVADSIEAGPFKRIDNNQWPHNVTEDS